MSEPSPQHPHLLYLPAEILPLIKAHLPYPDILSLRLAHPRFYHSPVLSTDNDAGIRQRVAWLCELAQHHARRSHSGINASNTAMPTLLSMANQSRSKAFTWEGFVQAKWRAFLRDLGRVVIPGVLDWNFDGYGNWSGVAVRLRTDAEFLANPKVQKILRRRRRHEECRGGVDAGCEVVMGATCEGPKTSCSGNRANALMKKEDALLFWFQRSLVVLLLAVALYWLRRLIFGI